jgi:hypothetical protein
MNEADILSGRENGQYSGRRSSFPSLPTHSSHAPQPSALPSVPWSRHTQAAVSRTCHIRDTAKLSPDRLRLLSLRIYACRLVAFFRAQVRELRRTPILARDYNAFHFKLIVKLNSIRITLELERLNCPHSHPSPHPVIYPAAYPLLHTLRHGTGHFFSCFSRSRQVQCAELEPAVG